MGNSTMCCKEADEYNKVLLLVISHVTLEGILLPFDIIPVTTSQ